MTKEEIIELAREAGFQFLSQWNLPSCEIKHIERFANLVAAKERERCAQICEKEGLGAKHQGDVYAHAIRSLK